MTTATIRKVNAAIAATGSKAELIKGDGYFYFVGNDISVDAIGVYVYRVSQLTVAEWMAEFAAVKEGAAA